MPELSYFSLASLDGYIADTDGNFDWAHPDEEVHQFVNDLSRPFRTMILGRRMYEVLKAWEDPAISEGQPAVIADFAEIWHSADKIVCSSSLLEPEIARTRIEPQLTPDIVAELKSTSKSQISIAGPEVASVAIRAGLVDDFHFVLSPVIIGSGTHSLPSGIRIDLELVDQRRFVNGAIYLRYRPQA